MGAKTSKANSQYAEILSQFEVIEQKEDQSAVIARSIWNKKVYLLRELTLNDVRDN